MEPNERQDDPFAFTRASKALCVRCGGLMVSEYYMDF
jgi:hypothetical protein